MPTGQRTTAALQREIEEVADLLRMEFGALVERVFSGEFRQTRLRRRFGIDKSLASRFARALESGTPCEFLHFLPSPAGLRILLGAVVEGEPAAREEVERAELGVRRLQTLLDEIPGGRMGLDAILSESLGEVHQRSSRTTRQGLYRHVTALLGHQCETLTSALLVVPSDHPDYLDAIELSCRVGLRRVRPTAAIAVFRAKVLEPEDQSVSSVRTLDGHPVVDPEATLLREFGDWPIPGLRVERQDGEVALVLTEEGWPLQKSLTVTSALRFRRAFIRVLPPGVSAESRSYLLHLPCRRLIREIYVHPGCGLGVPDFTVELPGPEGPPRKRLPGLLGSLGSIEVGVEVIPIDGGAPGGATRGVPAHPESVRAVFERTGYDPAEFTGYRVDVPYPVPFFYTTWWLRPAAI